MTGEPLGFSLVAVGYLSYVPLFATPWTVAHQAPLSMDSLGKNTVLLLLIQSLSHV